MNILTRVSDWLVPPYSADRGKTRQPTESDDGSHAVDYSADKTPLAIQVDADELDELEQCVAAMAAENEKVALEAVQESHRAMSAEHRIRDTLEELMSSMDRGSGE